MYALEVLSNFFSVWITIIFCICNSPFNNFIGIISSWRLYAEFHTAITAPIRNTINAIALVNAYLRILIFFKIILDRNLYRIYIYSYGNIYMYINVYNALYLDSMRRVHLQKEFTVNDIQRRWFISIYTIAIIDKTICINNLTLKLSILLISTSFVGRFL